MKTTDAEHVRVPDERLRGARRASEVAVFTMCAPRLSSSDRDAFEQRDAFDSSATDQKATGGKTADRSTAPRLGAAALALGLMGALAGCGGGQTHSASTASATKVPGASSVAGSQPSQSCVSRAMAGMSEAQRVGQLFMVGVTATGISAAQEASLRKADVGAVMLMGRSSAGVATTKAVVDRVQSLATTVRGAQARLLVGTDQEGGQVQVLKGPGFSAIPSGVVQGQWPDARLQAQAAVWARQLKAAGVNVNLAPVTDTVPSGFAASNAPIGALSREYGNSPATVAGHSGAFLRGMSQAGVMATLKHFPGLGRVRGNTDVAANVTDTQTTRDDPYLQPFRSGIQAGAPFVMVSSATYTRIDPNHQAAFSSVILRDVLRDGLGFRGVIISDDLGNAVAVQSIPAGQRAVRFIGAGGDMVLTDNPSAIGPMTSAVLGRLRSDAALRATVDNSVRRILTAKQNAGLLTCQ